MKSSGACRPYMLSPSMITMSNGNRCRAVTICCPTSYSPLSPVPLSPMTANFTEAALTGRAVAPFCAGAIRLARRSSVRRATARRIAHRLISRYGPADAARLGNPAVQEGDEPRRQARFISTGSKRILPLPVGQAANQPRRPLHVLARDAVAQQLGVQAAVIAKHDEVAVHIRDEARLLKHVQVVPPRRDAAGTSEREPEIADDVPLLRRPARPVVVLVQGVVRVLQIGAVEQQQDDEQPLIRPLADERVLLPRPLPAVLQRGQIETEAAALNQMRARSIAQRE